MADISGQILLAVVSSSFFGYMMKKIFDDVRVWIKSKTQDPFNSILPKIHEVYLILNSTMREVGCQSALIIKTENGGGKPKLGNPLYASILYETFDYPLSSMKQGLQKELLDASYIEILSNLDRAGKLSVDIKNMSPGMLKDMYLGHGVSQSRLIKIYESETRYIHLSLCFAVEEILDIPYKTEFIRQSVARLKKLFESEQQL